MYAWIKQIATSNRMYRIDVDSRRTVTGMELNSAVAVYRLRRPRTMCPALILAASRNDRVRGRTEILVVSIITRKGLSQSGAPSGRKWAINILGNLTRLDEIIDSQIGRPKDRVKMRWLDVLKA